MDANVLRRTPSIQPNQGDPSLPGEELKQNSVPVVVSRDPTGSMNLAVDAHDEHAPKVASEPLYSSGEKPVTNAPEVSKQPRSHSNEGTNAEVHTERNSNRRNKQAVSRKSKQGAVKQKLAPNAASCASKNLLQLLHSDDKAAAIETVKTHLRYKTDHPKAFGDLLALACQDKNSGKASLLLSIRTEVLGRQHSTATRDLRAAILATAGTENAPLLNELLDAHPHARRDPADSSAGTRVFNFFRKMTSWFGSDAIKWQRKEGKRLLQAAARTGNAQSMEILLTRCFDLVNDGRAIEQALKLAVDSNNPETTAVLLKKVLSEDPAYSESAVLTTMAAHAGNAGVLEVLVSNDMALPDESEWPGYFADIEFDLRQKAAEREIGGGKSATGSSSRLSPSNTEIEMARFTPTLGFALNAGQNIVNPAQKRCQLSAISLINLDNVNSQEVENAGFATDNATNAGRSLESSRRKRAEGVLQAVKTRLDATVSAFLAGGKVAPTLQADLTKAGMYGLVVDVVDTAFEQASEHASWNQEGVNHREILAAKLEEALSAKQDLFKEAASSSDDKVLFFKLLDQQLNFLAPYMPTGWAVTGGATVRQALPALPLQP